MKNYTTIARIENQFIYNAHYELTAREQKVLLFLISRINPLDKKFGIQTIPVKEIREVIMNKRSGSFYDEMLSFTATIVGKSITFDTSVKLKGKNMKGFVNWFQSIMPVHNELGEICLLFQFSQLLEPFLLELKEYTQINYLETIPLKSNFSVRMYQVFRAHRDKMSKHQKTSKLSYDLEAFKTLLKVGDNYKEWRDFNKRVLKPIVSQLNEHTDIKLQALPVRQGRKVIGIDFEFSDKATRTSVTTMEGTSTPNQVTRTLRLEKLTFAQLKAYNFLLGYGISEDIALEMISRVKGSEIIGFEDWYFELVIQIFESKTNQEGEAAKAGTLVNWFLKKKIFDQDDHFATVMERLQVRKKKLQTERLDAWDNRLMAKSMTSDQFTNQFKH